MSQVIEMLRSLDRKERFAVLRDVLGFDCRTPALNEGFRKRLSDCIRVEVPEKVFLATDYHLDWIQIAVHLAENPDIDRHMPFDSPAADEINKNQQDVDLLVAFEASEMKRPSAHLVLIEAKAYLGWTNGQLSRKTARLGRIFGNDGRKDGVVQPHFVLMTGRVSPNIQTCKWPNWMKDRAGNPFWLKYALPSRRSVTRCRPDGTADKSGRCLKFGLAAPSTRDWSAEG